MRTKYIRKKIKRDKRSQNRLLCDPDFLYSVRCTKHITQLLRQHQIERRKREDESKKREHSRG
uniref:Uncharacterized protein n=1 Tax=viral metagenome TaxID=1070528 RepID=A0A6H1ZNY8_9ZZZZ